MDIYFIGEKGLFDGNVNYCTVEDAYDYLSKQSVVSIDIETTRKFNGKYGEQEGLSPYLSKIVMFQIGTVERQYVIDHRYHSIGKLTEVLVNPDTIKVGHNLKFEYLHIFHNYGIRINNLFDTQVAEMILTCGIKDAEVSLKACINKYLKKEVDKNVRLEFLKIRDKPFTYQQLVYGAEDIITPLKIREIQLQLIQEWQLQNTVDLEMKFTEVLGDIEYKGMHFNKDAWMTIYNSNLPKYEEAKKVLNKFVEQYYYGSKFVSKQLDFFTTPGCSIMWSSSKQVVDFFKYLEACPQEMVKDSKGKKKLAYSVNAKLLMSSLNDLNKNQPEHVKKFIKDYVKYKEVEQSVTTFGEEFLKYVNPITKRVHSNYWQIIATGRMSSKNPNLQNIPSEERYRQCFCAPEGYNIINADYSGQETVVLANVSKEPNIGKLIIEGGDMHSFVASHISGKPYVDFMEMLRKKDTKEAFNDYDKKLGNYRQTAKAAGFAINYGGTGYTIAKNLGVSEEEGDKVYEAYFKAFPKLKDYFAYVKNITLRRGYVLVDEITHRKSFFKPPYNSKEKHAVEKKALNFPIQGTSGSMTKYAGILFRRWVLKNNLEQEVFITNLVHDEINVENLSKHNQIVKENLERCMIDAANIWCKDIPMKATAVIGTYWGH